MTRPLNIQLKLVYGNFDLTLKIGGGGGKVTALGGGGVA